MKRIITLLLMLFTLSAVHAQGPGFERRPWWWGLDMGATFQTSDMKPVGGIGWGITASRYSRLSKTGPLYFGTRFRFLDGRNYGYNYHALPGISANPVLSSGATNYTDSTGAGAVFSNYKMRFDEFAFELIIGSNRARKKGLLIYGFGGAGLNYWKTTTNQLDEFGNTYNYSAINTNGDDGLVRGQLEAMWDNTYETAANGSPSAKWSFMPSAGVGFGYQFANAFALGIEHRTTFALNDVIDGTNHNSLGQPTGNNDMYHYTGFFIRWTFGGNASSTTTTNNPPPPPPNPKNYPNNPNGNNNNNNVATNPNPVPNNNTTTTPNNAPPVQPPIVQFTTPGVDPFVTNIASQQLVAKVYNVSSKSQITLTINNQQSTNFSFNPSTHTLTFMHNLMNGNNVYQVSAYNTAGTATDVQTITYKVENQNNNPQPSALPPQVTINNPPTDPYNSTTANMNIQATVLNVNSASNIQVRQNGTPISNFTFNSMTSQLTFAASLQNGSNLFEVIGTNNVGSASDAVTINYSVANLIQPPVVTITNPASCPYTTKSSSITITATVSNVTAPNQVTVQFNNQNVTGFTFNAANNLATISFPVTLNAGNNNLTITGTNTAGTNSKSCLITLKPQNTVQPPTVTITNPSANPHTVQNPNIVLNATVLNVGGANEITVTANNVNMPNFTYDMNTKVLTLNTTLAAGTTIFTVSASNANGSDSKSTTIIYNQPPSLQPPVVNITQPNVNPYQTSIGTQTVVASVLNVTSANQITVKRLNGTDVPFSYNATAQTVTFTDNLVSGANVYTVTATNQVGTASDAVTIKYQSTSSGQNADTPNNNTPNNNSNSPGGRPNGNTVPSPNGNPSPSNNNTTGRPTQTPAQGDPVVTLITPSSENYISTVQRLSMTMKVTGVSSQSDIAVRVNGVRLMSIAYNTSTQMLTFEAALANGPNTVEVKATNAVGHAIKTVTVQYNPSSRTNNQNSDKPKTTTTTKPEEKPKTTTDKPKTTSEKPKTDSPKAQPRSTSLPAPKTTTPSSSPQRPR